MKYTKKNGKWIFEKDGVIYALTLNQVDEMAVLLREIQKAEHKKYGCVVNCDEDGDAETCPDCTWDNGDIEGCTYSMQGIKKEDCKYWVIVPAN